MKKITPFLWFDGRAEEAAKFYTSIFKRSKITDVSGPKGAVMSVSFTLDGQDFIALNGGPHFTFTPAISMLVSCKTQQEIDSFWSKLGKGGSTQQCGWLKDKFGLSWQIVPDSLGKVLRGKDAKGSQRAFAAMMKMVKLDIKALKKAYEG